MAQKHKLVNNCLCCGRIVCESEGEGPCFFCGNTVVGKNSVQTYEEDLEFFTKLDSDESLMRSYFKAMENRDKLLQFEKERVAQKNVIDEEADWYEIKDDVWQDAEVREQAMKKILKEEADEPDQEILITEFDANTRQFKDRRIKIRSEKEKKQEIEQFLEKVERFEKEKREGEGLIEQARLENAAVQKVLEGVKKNYRARIKDLKRREQVVEARTWEKKIQHEDDYENFEEMLKEQQRKKRRQVAEVKKGHDIEIYDLKKNYVPRCLTIWQPWASLIAYGIKRFEGRKWNSGYRGPLWIHAASTEPRPEDIREVERFYRQNFQRDKNHTKNRDKLNTDTKRELIFPKKYPTGCLVGLVDMQDVWTGQQYQQRLPKHLEKESVNPYVLVFRNPRILRIPVRCGGSKGIYEIPKERIVRTLKLLRKPMTDNVEYFANQYLGERKKGGFYEIRYVDIQEKMREEEEYDPVVKRIWEKQEGEEENKEKEKEQEKEQDTQNRQIEAEHETTPQFQVKVSKKKKRRRKNRKKSFEQSPVYDIQKKNPAANTQNSEKDPLISVPKPKPTRKTSEITIHTESFEDLISSEKNFANGSLLEISDGQIAQFANKILATLKKSLKPGLENKKNFPISFIQSSKFTKFIQFILFKKFSSKETGQFQHLDKLAQNIRFDIVKYQDARKWRRADKLYQMVYVVGKGIKLTDESRSAFVDIPDNHMFVVDQSQVGECFLFKQYKTKTKKITSFLDTSGDFDTCLLCFYFLH